MDYASLTADKNTAGSIRNWASQSNIPVDAILEQAEDHIYSLMRTREMHKAVTLNVVAGESTIALPDDFLDPVKLSDRYRIKIKHKTSASLETLMLVDTDTLELVEGYPKYWADYNECINFDCKAQEAMPYRLIYYKKPLRLSDDNPTNFLTNKYTHLMTAACLMYVAVWNEDDAAYAREGQRALQAIQDINKADDLSLRDVEVNAENY